MTLIRLSIYLSLALERSFWFIISYHWCEPHHHGVMFLMAFCMWIKLFYIYITPHKWLCDAGSGTRSGPQPIFALQPACGHQTPQPLARLLAVLWSCIHKRSWGKIATKPTLHGWLCTVEAQTSDNARAWWTLRLVPVSWWWWSRKFNGDCSEGQRVTEHVLDIHKSEVCAVTSLSDAYLTEQLVITPSSIFVVTLHCVSHLSWLWHRGAFVKFTTAHLFHRLLLVVFSMTRLTRAGVPTLHTTLSHINCSYSVKIFVLIFPRRKNVALQL